MKSKFICLLVLLFMVHKGFGQVMFQKVISPGYFSDGVESSSSAVRQTNDGGYIIAGYYLDSIYTGTIHSFAYLVKTNNEGGVLWTKAFGGIYYRGASDVQQTTDGGYIVVGTTGSAESMENVYLIKTDSNGDTLWTKAYGGTEQYEGYSVQQTNDTGFIIAGVATDSLSYLLKTNSIGEVTWSKIYSGIPQDKSVKQTSDSGYIVCGMANAGAFNSAVSLTKINKNGAVVWSKTYSGYSESVGNAVALTSDSGYIIAGSSLSPGADSSGLYLVKTNSIGDTLWTKVFAGIESNEFSGADIHETAGGGYIVTANQTAGGVGLIKTNASGDTLWTKTYGSLYNASGYSGIQSNDGGYIVTGIATVFDSLNSQATSIGIYVIKTDSYGNSGCNESSTNMIVSSTYAVIDIAIPTDSSADGTTLATSTIVSSAGKDSSLCLTTGINKLSNDMSVSLYPNPVADQLQIKVNREENNNLKLTIYNIAGEIIYSEALNRKLETVNCKPFSSGVYFITVADLKEQWVGRFVKE